MKNLYKKGVSLIAVLLFMLVATIAATATFKWLSSEGLSSGSRMMQKEAYQSAVAGLENARTWMTYHANDVGSLIKQYKDENRNSSGDGIKIKLNNQLRSLTRNGQNYDVWLAGVNTEESTYKLKIISTGKARNGSVHSEVGIFNVDGLYQVEIPRERVTATVDFEEAFFGNLATAGDIYVNSAIITQTPDVKNAGGQALNYMGITDYLILDGNFYVNASATMKDVYITGHFGFCADFTATGNLYVGGDLYPGAGASTATINGSAYVNGSVKLNSTYNLTSSTGGCSSTTTGSIAIGTNATINGPIEYYDRNGGSSFTVNGNLVLNSYIDFPDNYPTSLEYISVGHNAYIKEKSNKTGKIGTSVSEVGDYSVTFNHYSGYDYVHKTQFGSNINDQFYMNGVLYTYGNGSTQYPYYKCESCARHYCNNSYGLNCAVLEDNDIWVGFRGNYLTTPPSAATLEAWGADPMESYAEKVNTRDPNCSNEIKNPIQFNQDVLESSLIHSSSNLMGCDAGIFNTEWAANDWVTKVNTCYTIAQSRKELYNDEFLIIQTPDKMNMNASISTAFTHKIIWIYTASNKWMYSLPPTNDDGQVFLYLPEGIKNGITTGTNGDYDYFIYSDGDIASSNMQTQIRGSLVMGSCSRLNTNSRNPTLNISTDGTSIIDDMASAAIICNNDGTNKCSSGSGTGTSTETTSSTVTYSDTDAFYVANAPQLSVTLESQYKANESEGTAASTSTDIQAGFIVLPRIIYMTTDPYGELSDYYSVLPLNGLNYNKSNGTVSCSGSILTSGPLYNRESSNPTPLSDKYYTCSYTYGDKTVPFYIIAEGQSGNAPVISFKESSAEMGATDNHDVVVLVPPHDATITLNFTKPSDIDKWTFTKESGISCTGNQCTMNIGADAGSEVNLFRVTTTGASNGTAMFQLLSGEGYVIGTPSTMVLSVSSNVRVSRINVSESDRDAFCTSNPTLCPQNKSAWPDCPISSTSWVYAVGNNCTERTANMLWDCGIANDVSLQVSEDVPNWCVPIVPSYTHPAPLEANRTYELPAEIKAKPMKFLFGFSGSDISGKTIKASIATRSADTSCTYGSSISTTSSYCELEVFKGESVELSFPDGRPDNFNYWKCLGDNCEIKTPQSGDTYTIRISEDYLKVVAYFDETDKHCFFDEFKLSSPSCGEGTSNYCFSTSTSGTKKWYINNEADLSKIDYNDGYVSAKMNKNDKNGITVMSTAVAGLIGNLRAQFQVPRITTSTAVIPETIQKSGFILRSNTILGNDYLLLSFYADNAGLLTANLCSKNGTCKTTTFSGAYIDDRNTVVTLTANLNTEGISLSVLIGDFSSTSYSASIDFETEFSAYQNQGEYVGFRLADPNFKLFDIGWKSDDYGSECWDTYPTINCSFKVAYLGGIVPLKEEVEPWVGLSSWFDARGCSPKYYYKGEDACGGNNSSYTGCANNYIFDVKGKHGYTNGTVEYMTARAGVSGNECFSSLSSEDAALAEAEWAHCGTFWVGEMEECQNGIVFSRNGYYDGNALFTPPAPHETENLRLSTLKIELENTGNASVEIYLLSKLDESTAESKSFETTANGIAIIDIAAISDADNFDPENVSGVVVKTEIGSIVTIKDVYTICPNEASVSCGNLAYNASSHKWEFSLDVTNYSRLANLKIWKLVGEDVDDEPSGIVTDECTGNHSDEGTGTCYPIVKSGEKVASYKSFGTNASFEVEDLPYKSPDTYVIAAQLTTDAGEVKGCKTNSVTIEPISRECSIEGTTEVYEGAGIPQFTYSVSNCPSSGCSYKVDIVTNSGSDVTNISSEENVATPGGSTAGNEANVGSALAAGTYKFRLKSTDDDLPFADCEKEFTVKKTPKANCTEASISDGKFIATLDWSNWSGSLIFTDYLGHPMEGIPVNGTSTNFSYDIPEDLLTCSTGTCNYQATLQPAGNECAATWTVVEQLSLSGCPSSDITGTSKTFTPTVTGCGAGDCSWEISGSASISPTAATFKNGDDVTISNATPGTTYTLTLKRGTASKTCSVKFKSDGPEESDITATCYFEQNGGTITEVFTETDIKLIVKNPSEKFQGSISGKKSEWNQNKNVDKDWNVSDKCFELNQNNSADFKTPVTATLSGTNYTYMVFDAQDKLVCSAVLKVKAVVGCSVTKTTVAPGEQFTMSAEYAGSGGIPKFSASQEEHRDWLDWDNAPSYSNFNYTFTAHSTPGEYDYCAVADNGSPAGKCCIVITVAETDPPSIECPDDAYTVAPDADVSFKPESIAHCAGGCSYTIQRIYPSETVASSGTNKSYKGGTIKFNDEGITGDNSYRITVDNGIGTDYCEFDVTYDESSSGGGSFEYSAYNEKHTFSMGQSYSITCPKQDGSYRSLCCWSADYSSGHKFKINGEEKTLNPGNWGGSGNCTNGSATLEASSDVDVVCIYCN